MKKEIKKLVYGKSELLYVVGIEPQDDGTCVIFREDPDEGLIEEVVPFRPYILSKYALGSKWTRLKDKQHYKYIRKYRDLESYYDALKLLQRRNKDIYTIRNPKEAFMCKTGVTYFKGMKKEDLSILSVDIEDTYGIGKTPRDDGKLLLIANTFRKNGKIIKKQFAYDDFKSEKEMLKAWSKWVNKCDPHVYLGHNIFNHDFKIINHAAKRWKIKLKLGRDGSEMYIPKRNSLFRVDGSQSYNYKNIQIYGREIIDTWRLAMLYDKNSRREYENYKLKYIIAFEKLEKEDRVHYDAANIYEDYKDPKKWEMIKKYNVDDGDDPLAYFDLVIPVFFQYTKSIPRSFQMVINSATGSQVNYLMIRSYLQLGYSIARASDAVKYPGAISFGIPGIYKNVFKIDVQSLYPSIILTYLLWDKKKDPKKHMIKMLSYFTDQRIRNKVKHKETGDKTYKILSDSQKIVINSVYGFYGAPKLNYNNPRIASKVTEIGRDILTQAMEWASGSSDIPENAEGGKVNVKEEEL